MANEQSVYASDGVAIPVVPPNPNTAWLRELLFWDVFAFMLKVTGAGMLIALVLSTPFVFMFLVAHN